MNSFRDTKNVVSFLVAESKDSFWNVKIVNSLRNVKNVDLFRKAKSQRSVPKTA